MTETKETLKKKIWILVYSEFIAGLICIFFLLNLNFKIKGDKIAYFNSCLWMIIIFIVIIYAFYHRFNLNKGEEKEK